MKDFEYKPGDGVPVLSGRLYVDIVVSLDSRLRPSDRVAVSVYTPITQSTGHRAASYTRPVEVVAGHLA